MTPEAREKTLVRVNGLALAAWSGFLIWAYFSGALEVLHPSFRWLCLTAGCALAPMAAAVVLGGSASCEAGCAGHAHAGTARVFAARIGMRLALGAPIALGVTVPMRGLSADAVQRRGVRMLEIETRAPSDAAESEAEPVPPEEKQAAKPEQAPAPAEPEEEVFYEEMTFRDIVERVSGPEGEAAIEKLNVAMIGQYLKDEDCGERQFKLYRIRITCCLADAEVMAVLVETKKPFTRKMSGDAGDQSEVDALVEEARVSGDRSGFRLVNLMSELGGWVRAMGRLKIYLDSEGGKRLKLIADKVERIEPPEKKYLFIGEDDLFY